jgi:hypothetical protein
MITPARWSIYELCQPDGPEDGEIAVRLCNQGPFETREDAEQMCAYLRTRIAFAEKKLVVLESESLLPSTTRRSSTRKRELSRFFVRSMVKMLFVGAILLSRRR